MLPRGLTLTRQQTEEGMKSKRFSLGRELPEYVSMPANREKGERFMGKGEGFGSQEVGIQTPSDGADL